MNKKKLSEIKKQLSSLRKSPCNINSKILVNIAKKLGRLKENHGKEPYYERKNIPPRLNGSLSIPHRDELKPGTARNIIDFLINDVDEWELFLIENESDEKNQ